MTAKILPIVEDSSFSIWLWLKFKCLAIDCWRSYNVLCHDNYSEIYLIPPLPDAEQGCKDRSVYLGEVVVAVVDRLQLVQLGEGVPGDLHKLVERGVQKLYSLLVLHRNLTKESWSSVVNNHHFRCKLNIQFRRSILELCYILEFGQKSDFS